MAPRSPFNVMPMDPATGGPALPGGNGAAPTPMEEMLIELTPDEGGEYEHGISKTELEDGSVLIDLEPKPDFIKSDDFNANLAKELDEGVLQSLATEIIEGIRRDDASRSEWVENYKKGLNLLALKLKDPSASPGDGGSPLEGMSNVDHPALLQAVLNFQAVARGELLPATGPVKIRDDKPSAPQQLAPPPMPMPPMNDPNAAPQGGNGVVPPPSPQGPPPSGGMAAPPGSSPFALGGAPVSKDNPLPFYPANLPDTPRDEVADALEKDMNHYLTTTATEYYPDTDQMLFLAGYGGTVVKKVYNCPIRRRPVSESVPIEKFIVSDALTDLNNAARITHEIEMRPSTMKRMQLLGAYRDIPLGAPTMGDVGSANQVAQSKGDIVGVQKNTTDPEDADYQLYETLCELDIPGYEHKNKKGKVTGLKLPYRVVIERESEKILEIRRNWKEDDPLCMPREMYVDYTYCKAFGFYGIGLLHIMGNTTKALTAVWREFIDSGMFSSFPGFIYDKGAGRQLTNEFRVPPGGGVGLDAGLKSIRDSVMAVPYKDLGPGFSQFVMRVEEFAQQLGGTANIAVGEGKQDAPVGTTLALIDQATKAIGAVLKRMHSSQAREFKLLKECFRNDPAAFWRFNPRPARKWDRQALIQALNDYDMVPVADPNNPTSMHRAAKAQALVQYQMQVPALLDPKKVWRRWAKEVEINDPDELLLPPIPPQPPQPDPTKMAELQVKTQIEGQKGQLQMMKGQADVEIERLKAADREAERQFKLHLAEIEQQTEKLRLAGTFAIHADKTEAGERALRYKFEDAERSQQRKRESEQLGLMHEHAQGEMGHQRQYDNDEAERQHRREEAERDRQHKLEVERIKASAAKAKASQAKKKAAVKKAKRQ